MVEMKKLKGGRILDMFKNVMSGVTFLSLAAYSFLLSTNFSVSFLGVNGTLSFFIGFLLILCLFLRGFQVRYLPLFVVVILIFPLLLDIGLRNRSVDEYIQVFFFNALVFYSVSCLLIRSGQEKVYFFLMIFVSGYLVFSGFGVFAGPFVEGRAHIGGRNPNDNAAIGFFAVAIVYFLTHTKDDEFGRSKGIILYRSWALVSLIGCISLVGLTGTRYAVFGIILLSAVGFFRALIINRSFWVRRFSQVLYFVGFLLSLSFAVGVGGLDHTSKRIDINALSNSAVNSESELTENSKSIGDSAFRRESATCRTLDCNLGRIDSSMLSLGGRVPTWKLAYYTTVDTGVLLGSGWDKYIQASQSLGFPTPHNYLVESFIAGGVIGASLVAGLLLVALLFFGARYFLSQDCVLYLIFVPILILVCMMNIWYLKIFWFALAILVSFLSGLSFKSVKRIAT